MHQTETRSGDIDPIGTGQGIRPVFVVGMNGSGTTMLADSLGFHPALFMFPFEPRILPYVIQKARRYGALERLVDRRRVADELCDAKPIWHANARQRLVLSDAELGSPGLAATIDAVFRHFARKQGKCRWGEKSPMNVLHMTLLAEVFPEARFVHILRDGRDAAQSFERRFGFVPEETVFRWRQVVEAARQQALTLGARRYLEVRYEDVTADPERWMRLICNFVDLPFDNAVLSSSMRMAGPHLAAQSGRRMIPNSERWRSYFSPERIVRLEKIAGARLSDLGYSVDMRGTQEPGRLTRWQWRVRGLARRSYLHFKQLGWPGLRGYLKLVVLSIKQNLVRR